MASDRQVQSLTRAVALVRLVSRADDGLTLQQLSHQLDLKPPTVHNLAKTLHSQGLLDKRDKPIRYVLGPALMEMTEQYGHRTLLKRAGGVMQQVSQQLDNGQISFAEPTGGDVLMTLRVISQAPGVIQQPRNAMASYVTASVLLFQAYWADDERIAYQQRYPFDEFGAPLWGTQDKLDAYLAQVRQQGYAALEIEPPGHRVAVPVYSKRGVVIAALGAYVTCNEKDKTSISLDVIVDCLKHAAEEIGRDVHVSS